MTTELKNPTTLLQGIVDGLRSLERRADELDRPSYRLSDLEVLFVEAFNDGAVVWTGDLISALDYITNDVYWNEQGDWREADSATVRVM